MPTKKKSTLLITGAAGFVGQRTVELALAETDFSVCAADHPQADLDAARRAGARVRSGDLAHPEKCARILRGADVVMHLASVYDPTRTRAELMRMNRATTRTLAKAAAQSRVRHFLFCSTAEVYGAHRDVPIKEDARKVPDNDFSLSMLAAEQAVMRIGRETGMPVTILRPAIVYGPGGSFLSSALVIAPFLAPRIARMLPTFTGGPLINAVHVDDVAGALLFLAERSGAFGEAFNVADDDWLALGEFLEKIWETIGVRGWVKLPMMKGPVKWASIFLDIATPDFALDMVNYVLERRWERVQRERHVDSALSPRLDRGFLSYGAADHVYDTTKLTQLGYRLRYPNFDRGYAQTVANYKKRNWLPGVGASRFPNGL